MTTAAETDYSSLGQLAAHLQKPVRKIEQVASALKLAPAMRLNGVVYFDGRQVEKITTAMNGSK